MNKGSDYYCIGWVKWWLKKKKLKDDKSLTVFELNVGRVFDSYVHEKKRYLVFLSGDGKYKVSVPEKKTYHNMFNLACGEKMPKLIYSQFYVQFKKYFVPTIDKRLKENILRCSLIADSAIIDNAVTTLDSFDQIPEYNRNAF